MAYEKAIRTTRDATEFFPFGMWTDIEKDWDEIHHWSIKIRDGAKIR